MVVWYYISFFSILYAGHYCQALLPLSCSSYSQILAKHYLRRFFCIFRLLPGTFAMHFLILRFWLGAICLRLLPNPSTSTGKREKTVSRIPWNQTRIIACQNWDLFGSGMTGPSPTFDRQWFGCLSSNCFVAVDVHCYGCKSLMVLNFWWPLLAVRASWFWIVGCYFRGCKSLNYKQFFSTAEILANPLLLSTSLLLYHCHGYCNEPCCETLRPSVQVPGWNCNEPTWWVHGIVGWPSDQFLSSDQELWP